MYNIYSSGEICFKNYDTVYPPTLNSHLPQIKPVYFHTFNAFFPCSALPIHNAYVSTPSCLSASLATFLLLNFLLFFSPSHPSFPNQIFLSYMSFFFPPFNLVRFFIFLHLPLSFASFQLDLSELLLIIRFYIYISLLISLFCLFLLHFFFCCIKHF